MFPDKCDVVSRVGIARTLHKLGNSQMALASSPSVHTNMDSPGTLVAHRFARAARIRKSKRRSHLFSFASLFKLLLSIGVAAKVFGSSVLVLGGF